MIIETDRENFELVFKQNKINKYGYLPKEGHWIKVKGYIFDGNDGYNKKIKFIKEFKHINNPYKKKNKSSINKKQKIIKNY